MKNVLRTKPEKTFYVVGSIFIFLHAVDNAVESVRHFKHDIVELEVELMQLWKALSNFDALLVQTCAFFCNALEFG